MSRGCVCASTGHPAEAVRMITSGFSARQSTGTTVWTPFRLSCLATAQARLGRSEDALCSIEEAIAVLETTNERWCEAEVHRTVGEIALLMPEPDWARAEACFKRAIAVSRPTSEVLGAPGGHEPGETMARARKAGRGLRPACACVQLVHRRKGYVRPEEREGPARRPGFATITGGQRQAILGTVGNCSAHAGGSRRLGWGHAAGASPGSLQQARHPRNTG